MEYFFALIANAVFFCIKVFVPLVFIFRKFIKSRSYINMEVLIISLNISLLIGGSSALFNLIGNVILLSPNGMYNQYYSLVTHGATLWPYLLLVAVSYNILPQMGWLKKIRISDKFLYAWVITALIETLWHFGLSVYSFWSDFIPFKYTIQLSLNFPSLSDGVLYLMIFLMQIAVTYFIVLKRVKTLNVDGLLVKP
jgi:hypothetical protein